MAKPTKPAPVKEIPVELGFVEEGTEPWKLTSAFFPSKVGGKPAWLNLRDIPKWDTIKCGSCNGPMRFLLQIYAPLGTEPTAHRSLFVFICTEPRCCVERNSNKNILTYRSVLDYQNEFYAPEPKDFDLELSKLGPQDFGVHLCRTCGILGEKHCGACKKVYYCTKEHQVLDWSSRHKKECTDMDFKPESSSESSSASFTEFEVVIDKEVIPKVPPKKKQSDTEKLKEYEKMQEEGKIGSLGGDSSAATKEMLEAASYKSDKVFNKFRKRVAYEPQQIIRYDRGGEPLWVSPEKIPSKDDIPPCSGCKAPRVFEFQIMPQLLNHLGEESIDGALDWGTIAIYTCGNDCKVDQVEFVYQQDFKPDDRDESGK